MNAPPNVSLQQTGELLMPRCARLLLDSPASELSVRLRIGVSYYVDLVGFVRSSSVRQGILIASVLLSASCRAPTAIKQLLHVGIAVSATSVRIGTPLDVSIVARNHGDQAITVNSNTCPYVFRVEDVRGTVVGPESQICDLALRQRTLAPGDSLVFSYRWEGRGVGGDYANPAPLLSPGQYYLRAQVLSESGVVRSDRVAVLLLP